MHVVLEGILWSQMSLPFKWFLGRQAPHLRQLYLLSPCSLTNRNLVCTESSYRVCQKKIIDLFIFFEMGSPYVVLAVLECTI